MEFITAQGLQKLKDELSALVDRRPKVVIDLDEARKQGDLSENFGYHAAKDELRKIDQRIAALKEKIPACKVIQAVDDGVVSPGSYVKVEETTSNKISVFRIVGGDDLLDSEAIPHITYITWSSKVARALDGKKVGSKAEVSTPGGERHYLVLEVSVTPIDV